MLVEVDPRVRVRLGMDRMTGKPRGFAFAEFSDATMAADAIRRFDSVELRGRRLRVNDADDKPPPRAPRPPRFPGAGTSPGGGGGGYRPAPLGGSGGYGGGSADFPPPDFGAGGFPPFKKNGGSRRGLRGKKRSLR
jgi:RNA recognition motif-containing protein